MQNAASHAIGPRTRTQLDEFSGGGTKFAHASEALSVAPGEAMVFCGYNVVMTLCGTNLSLADGRYSRMRAPYRDTPPLALSDR